MHIARVRESNMLELPFVCCYFHLLLSENAPPLISYMALERLAKSRWAPAEFRNEKLPMYCTYFNYLFNSKRIKNVYRNGVI